MNVITLGCSKNLVDSEVMMAQLRANEIDVGHEKEVQDHNIVIVNTCGFIDNAKTESIEIILEQVEAKKAGLLDKVYVSGCLSQRFRDELSQEIPDVDAWFGTLELPQLLKKFNANYRHELIGERFLTTPQHYAYLKISEGCNRTCAFCAIPLMRGKHVSRTIEDLVIETRQLAATGVKELILVAQELTYYGIDLYKKRKLDELLLRLADVEGIEWIRLHYTYPSKFPMEILKVIRENEKVCSYLDLPLQHISDPMLASMKRQITKQETLDLVNQIRQEVPGIALRTTMLVGFPGETEDDFQQLCDFIQASCFDRLGVFTYSHEEGTSGFTLSDDVPPVIKDRRAANLMELQQEISLELNSQKVGKTLKVMFDKKESGYFYGRSLRQAEFGGNRPAELLEIDTRELPPGLYLLRLDLNGAAAVTHKLIKHP